MVDGAPILAYVHDMLTQKDNESIMKTLEMARERQPIPATIYMQHVVALTQTIVELTELLQKGATK